MAQHKHLDDDDSKVPRQEDDAGVDKAAGEVLGIAHVPADGTLLPPSTEDEPGRRESVENEVHGLGNREVTQGQTGGTNTDTGGGGAGARELRKGSGHTGTDIGR